MKTKINIIRSAMIACLLMAMLLTFIGSLSVAILSENGIRQAMLTIEKIIMSTVPISQKMETLDANALVDDEVLNAINEGEVALPRLFSELVQEPGLRRDRADAAFYGIITRMDVSDGAIGSTNKDRVLAMRELIETNGNIHHAKTVTERRIMVDRWKKWYERRQRDVRVGHENTIREGDR